jgi:branched-chain amino acid aminotransferase
MAQHAARADAGEAAAAGAVPAAGREATCPGEVAWVDGAVVPRDRAAVPLSDAGFVLGATVTEQLRTFRGRLFLPELHAARMRESLAIVGIGPATPLERVFAAAADVAAANHAAVSAARPGWDGDLGVVVFATPGDLPAQAEARPATPRTFIHSFPLAFGLWARAYDAGLSLRSVRVRQVPDSCWPLAAKVRSRLHYHLADREAHAAEPGARAVLCHADGRVSETSTANVAVVTAGRIAAPPPADALPGVSLAYARQLAAAAGIPWETRSLTAADLAAADEILLTSTPSCILPATRFDGRPVGTGGPGPVFRRLLAAWAAAVGVDIAGQARRCAAG